MIGCNGKVYWYGIVVERREGRDSRLGLGWIKGSIGIVHCHVSKVKTNQ